MKILPATVKDAGSILMLQKSAYQQEAEIYRDFSIPPLIQTQKQIESEFRETLFLKAVHKNEIIGSVRAIQDGDTCLIGRLIVHPNRQGNGIGTMLMADIEKKFDHCRRYELFTGTKSLRNIRLYKKLGYLPFKEKTIHSELSLVYLEKIK